MTNELDKKAIRERIEALRKKIQSQGIEAVAEKRTTSKLESNTNHSLGEESFFYLLETKTLIISISVCLIIITTAYTLSLKTDYLNIAARYIFQLFS